MKTNSPRARKNALLCDVMSQNALALQDHCEREPLKTVFEKSGDLNVGLVCLVFKWSKCFCWGNVTMSSQDRDTGHRDLVYGAFVYFRSGF